uniref:Uncharacterized protein n=1 Tax=Schistosoma haematobium TaxID=6185 RepID=A0A095CCX0_SCHHA
MKFNQTSVDSSLGSLSVSSAVDRSYDSFLNNVDTQPGALLSELLSDCTPLDCFVSSTVQSSNNPDISSKFIQEQAKDSGVLPVMSKRDNSIRVPITSLMFYLYNTSCMGNFQYSLCYRSPLSL